MGNNPDSGRVALDVVDPNPGLLHSPDQANHRSGHCPEQLDGEKPQNHLTDEIHTLHPVPPPQSPPAVRSRTVRGESWFQDL